ncbi:MAG: site-2 protease family protein [Planctomycetota bacterium]
MEGLTAISQVLMVVLGIGLVIFVHELGHFLAARLTGVRVEVFSLGFGPRLLGWKRGATRYQVALVPLGGYVRMAGEDRSRADDVPAGDELPAKSPAQRFFIYSGGVAMNVVFAVVVFPVLFYLGVPFFRPVVGMIEPGGAAWVADLDPRAEVVAVNGREIFDWAHIPTAVALGDPARTTLVLRDPRTGALETRVLVPQRSEAQGLYTIGTRPGLLHDEEGHVVLDAEPGTPAFEAGVRGGDRLLAVRGGTPGLAAEVQLDEALATRAALRLLVASEAGVRREVVIEPRAERVEAPRVGIQPIVNRVAAVRAAGPARTVGLQAEDRLLAAQGVPILRHGDLRRALLEEPGPLALEVRRGAATLRLEGPALDRDAALALADDVALVQDLASPRIVLLPGEPAAAAGLQDGDLVLTMNDDVEVTDWNGITDQVMAAVDAERTVGFVVARADPGGEGSRLVTVDVAAASPQVPVYGLGLRRDQYEYRTASVPDSLAVGVIASWRFLEDTWLTFKRILLHQVSFRNMGGIIAIAQISYSQAESGWVSLFFFLCMLSINLAFLNVLPIPVLDGGHLFFLVVEMIKGSPVSDRVLGYSQMVGVVIILSLLVAVTYNDLMRAFFSS